MVILLLALHKATPEPPRRFCSLRRTFNKFCIEKCPWKSGLSKLFQVMNFLQRNLQNLLSLHGAALASNTTRSFKYGTSADAALRLAGKVAIITGAASGIGAATARLFAENGAKVIIADIQDELGSKLAQELGPDTHYIRCDVTQEDDVRATVDFAISKYDQLDIMFNNAGICSVSTKFSALSPISEIKLTDFDHICNVNMRGALLGVKYASRVMIPKKSGSILSTASVTAVQAQKTCHAYTISKHGIIGITRTAASELSMHGIRVNCLSPSVINTPLAAVTLDEVHSTGSTLDDLLAANSELYGIKLETTDIARAALFLASAEGRFISGHNLVIDGSFSISKPFNPFKNPHVFDVGSS